VREQRVLVGDVGVGVEADGRHLVDAARGLLVQGLYVFEDVLEFEIARVELAGREAVEHEGVVGVGRVGDGDGTCLRFGGG
jgi:hypothetical protein